MRVATLLLLGATSASTAFGGLPRWSGPKSPLGTRPLPATTARPPALARNVPPAQWLLPALSYSGLGAVTAGAVKIVGASGWAAGAMIGASVALPAALVLLACARGGASLAASMGGRQGARAGGARGGGGGGRGAARRCL
jgi:hypothetical protein